MSASEEMYLKVCDILLPRETHGSVNWTFIQEFQFKDDDVLVVTYPKSGAICLVGNALNLNLPVCKDLSLNITSGDGWFIWSGARWILVGTIWMQQVIPLVLNGGDLTPVQTLLNWKRAPWIEITKQAQFIKEMTSPRPLVTHLPYNLIPPSFYTSKVKAIYVMRNPKDVLVSMYYFHQMANFLEDPGTFDEFMDTFLEGRVMYGKWTDHVRSWTSADLGDRIMFITYEEMLKDLPASVRRISDFLCRDLSEEVTQKIAEHSSFQSMKANKMSNYSQISPELMDTNKSPFLRKGVAGDWKNHFSSEQLSKFTSVIHRELKGVSSSLLQSLD